MSTMNEMIERVHVLEDKLDETTKTGIELHKELTQAKRDLEVANQELERWRHGKTVEGDYVCPHKLELGNLQTQVIEEHAMLASELGSKGDFIAQIKTLKRKLAETEKAGEDIRKKNEELLAEFRKWDDHLLGKARPVCYGKSYDPENKECRGCPFQKACSGTKMLETGAARLPKMDKTIIDGHGKSWEEIKVKYEFFLDMAKKHGMVIVVLP